MLFRWTRLQSTRVPPCLSWARRVVLLCALFACGTAVAAPPIVHGDNNPYDQDWLVVWWTLRTKCTRCHRPGTERHDFTSYRGVIGGGLDGASHVVIPGDPDGSLLWENVVWNHAGLADSPHPDEPMMPPDRSEWLTTGQLTALRNWISNGAREYRRAACPGDRDMIETDFPSARECAGCHPKQYEEWSRSMHAYTQHSPTFEAFTLTMTERTGGTIGTFCTRCHTPLGVSLGETASLRNVHRSRIAMEGVTCVVCHRMSRPYYKSSGRIPVRPGQVLTDCEFGPFDNPVRFGDSTHEARGGDYIRSAAFCGTCHDVTSPQGVRLEEAFSEWQNSPSAKRDIACQLCHMGPVAGVPTARHQRPYGKAATVPGIDPSQLPDRPLSDHTFAGPDYSLLPDTEFPHKLDWMYETDYRNQAALTPYQRDTLTALRVRNRLQLQQASAKRYELLTNAATIDVQHPSRASAGEWIHVNVEVNSNVAGHNLPTGFTEERQVWVEVLVTDPAGRVVFVSGDRDPNEDLRNDHSHFVEEGELHADPYLLNFQSKFLAFTLRGTERSVIIPVNRHLMPLTVIRPPTGIAQSFGRAPILRVAKGSVPPLQSVDWRYPVHLPDVPGDYAVQVRLNYRHLPPVLLDRIGVPQLKPLLEVLVIDQYSGSMHVGG
jgi:Cytochrome c554 and c-prime